VTGTGLLRDYAPVAAGKGPVLGRALKEMLHLTFFFFFVAAPLQLSAVLYNFRQKTGEKGVRRHAGRAYTCRPSIFRSSRFDWGYEVTDAHFSTRDRRSLGGRRSTTRFNRGLLVQHQVRRPALAAPASSREAAIPPLGTPHLQQFAQ